MDDKLKFISKDKRTGYFQVIFRNRNSMDVSEIENFFSKYGKVMHVTITGDSKGYRFVSYQHLTEAEEAVADLTNHATIKLEVFDPSKKLKRKGNDTNQKENNGARKKEATSHNSSFFSDTASRISNVSFESDRTLGPAMRNRHESISSKSNYSMLSRFSNTHNITQLEPNYSNNSDDDSMTSNSNNNSCVTNPSVRSISRTSELGSMFMFNKQGHRNVKLLDPACEKLKAMKIDKKMSSSKALSKATGKKTDNSSDLSKLGAVKKIVHKEAETVVVGNIRPGLTAIELLSVFSTGHDVLGMSSLIRDPDNKVDFCYVYFMTKEEAMTFEDAFDQFNLEGQKLVALRPCRLKIEGKSHV